MKYTLAITERTPTPPERMDLNTYHIVYDSLFDVAKKLVDLEVNCTVVVNISIAPFVP